MCVWERDCGVCVCVQRQEFILTNEEDNNDESIPNQTQQSISVTSKSTIYTRVGLVYKTLPSHYLVTTFSRAAT